MQSKALTLLKRAINPLVLASSMMVTELSAEPLRVVLELSPPHQTVNNGKVAGLTTAVVDDMLQHAGLTPSYEVYPWARAFHIAATTPNVLIYNMARTPERESQFEWIGTVASYKFGVLKLRRRTDIHVQQLSDIAKYVMGAQRDDFAAEWLRDYAKQPAQNLQLQPDVVETWRLLVNGKVELMIDDPQAIEDMLTRYQLDRQEIEFLLFPPELEQQTWIALKKGSSPALVQRLRQAFQHVHGNANHQKVMRNTGN